MSARAAHVDAEIVDLPRARRVYRGEELYFDLVREFGLPLRDAFVKCGIAPRVSSGLVYFLYDQMRLERHQDPTTRVEYRKILRSLDPDQVREFATQSIGG